MSEEKHLRVFQDRSELHSPGNEATVFHEGPQTSQAKARYAKLRSAFEAGYFDNLISEMKRSPSAAPQDLPQSTLTLIEELVDSVSSENGRAIVALSVMQSCVKAICPEQSVRLHKGDQRHGGDRFSWKEGISMRSLDSNFVTPVLRKYDLLRLNADGFMMTRSLAENYPYSALYKAALRGGRSQWLALTDLLESGEANAEAVLKTLISFLLNRTASFQALADSVVSLAGSKNLKIDSLPKAIRWFEEFVKTATYSARVFEISMHALYQALAEKRLLPFALKPLSQMRSANKKHGNIGDIELIKSPRSLAIVESWDAKYGKPYLADELEELNEKLRDHEETRIAGFVVDSMPDSRKDIEGRRKELEEMHGVSIYLMPFSEWVKTVVERFQGEPVNVSQIWLTCFVESLCQKRREMAPIDEPCDVWVSELKTALDKL
jgi:hypothetical protein